MAGFAPKFDDEVDPKVVAEEEKRAARNEAERGYHPKKQDDAALDGILDKLIDVVAYLQHRLDEVERSMASDSERYMPGELPFSRVGRKRSYH